MPSENAEFVRRTFDAFPRTQERLREGTLPLGAPLAEDVVWDASEIRLPDLGNGVLRGRDGVRRFWMAWLSAWDDVNYDYELFEVGDKVLAAIDQQNETSRIAVGLHYAQIWTFKEGEVVHWKIYTDQEAAFAAVGLERQGSDRA